MRDRLRFVVVCLAAGIWCSKPACAAEALFLTWGDCPLGTAMQTAIFDCATNTSQDDLYCAFRLAQPVDSVLALEIVVDVQSASATLPDWWHFEPEGCRSGLLTADDDFTGKTACVDFWNRGTSGGEQSYTPTLPRGQANQARIRIALNVPSTEPRFLDAANMYYAAHIALGFGKTTGTGFCAGCQAGACLVLNSILVKRPPRPEGTASTDVFVSTPGPGGANWALWQAGGADCQAVPVRRSTWGAIKALYR